MAGARRNVNGRRIDFRVADACDEDDLMSLSVPGGYDGAVCNMAVMDMNDLDVLMRCVHRLLADGGAFVFSTQHPCFVTLTERYLTGHSYEGDALPGQPVRQNYHHRSLQDLLIPCFRAGFSVDGLRETGLPGRETPEILIVRLRKA